MTNNLKFRIITIVAVILICIYGIIGLPKSKEELVENWKKNIRGIPSNQAGTFRQIVNETFGNAWILTPVNQTDYRMTMQPTYALKLRQDTLTQSMSTIEKKINGLGL